MKIEFFENDYGASFDLKPETIEEVATLARIANNTSSKGASVNFYFSDSPSASVWIKKVSKKAQRNSIGKNRS